VSHRAHSKSDRARRKNDRDGGGLLALLLAILASTPVAAEQSKHFGDWDVHYVVIPSTFLRPQIATNYNLVRAKDRSLVNVSVVATSGKGTRARLQGSASNLLGQRFGLEFREVTEGSAIYYLAELEHTNEEVLRFRISVSVAGEPDMLMEFQQKLYWEDADAGGPR